MLSPAKSLGQLIIRPSASRDHVIDSLLPSKVILLIFSFNNPPSFRVIICISSVGLAKTKANKVFSFCVNRTSLAEYSLRFSPALFVNISNGPSP